MPIPRKQFARWQADDALAATLWFEPNLRDLEALKSLLDSGTAHRVGRDGTIGSGRSGAATILLRHAVFLSPPPVRPYFAVCALEAWRRVSVRQLAGWSGIPFTQLKRRLAVSKLTPAGVAAWNLALHATWLLDVAELPATVVAGCMGLNRSAALSAVLGARTVPFHAGRVESGAFTTTLNRYIALLRAAFQV